MGGWIIWSKYDPILGTQTDRIIAQIIGCHLMAVYWRRRKLGIDAFVLRCPIDWDVVSDLGQVPDVWIAERLGVSRERVRQVRKERGIPRPRRIVRNKGKGVA
jgi:hypothetical protein